MASPISASSSPASPPPSPMARTRAGLSPLSSAGLAASLRSGEAIRLAAQHAAREAAELRRHHGRVGQVVMRVARILRIDLAERTDRAGAHLHLGDALEAECEPGRFLDGLPDSGEAVTSQQ